MIFPHVSDDRIRGTLGNYAVHCGGWIPTFRKATSSITTYLLSRRYFQNAYYKQQ